MREFPGGRLSFSGGGDLWGSEDGEGLMTERGEGCV